MSRKVDIESKYSVMPDDLRYSIQNVRPSRYFSLWERIQRFIYDENIGYFFLALEFTMPDTSLYFSSINNFPKHWNGAGSPLTSLETPEYQWGFIAMLVGSVCTALANVYSYFFINKKYWSRHESSPFTLTGIKKWLLAVILITSICNKSIATSTSFLALLNDYIESTPAKWVNFGLAVLANLLAQLGVQGISTNWHFGLKKFLALLLSAVFAFYYTISVLALNWNAIDNILGTRPKLDSAEGVWKLIASLPLFFCAFVRTPFVYYEVIGNRLLSGRESRRLANAVRYAQSIPREQQTCYQQFNKRLQQFTGYGASLQRTAIMLGTLWATTKAATQSIWPTLTAVVVFGWGTAKSNHAVMGYKEGPRYVGWNFFSDGPAIPPPLNQEYEDEDEEEEKSACERISC